MDHSGTSQIRSARTWLSTARVSISSWESLVFPCHLSSRPWVPGSSLTCLIQFQSDNNLVRWIVYNEEFPPTLQRNFYIYSCTYSSGHCLQFITICKGIPINREADSQIFTATYPSKGCLMEDDLWNAHIQKFPTFPSDLSQRPANILDLLSNNKNEQRSCRTVVNPRDTSTLVFSCCA